MKKETILDTDRVSLFCYPDEKMVHHIVHKYVQGDDFRKLMTAGADAFLKHRCTKWLSDDRSSTVLKKKKMLNERKRPVKVGTSIRLFQ